MSMILCNSWKSAKHSIPSWTGLTLVVLIFNCDVGLFNSGLMTAVWTSFIKKPVGKISRQEKQMLHEALQVVTVGSKQCCSGLWIDFQWTREQHISRPCYGGTECSCDFLNVLIKGGKLRRETCTLSFLFLPEWHFSSEIFSYRRQPSPSWVQ